MLLYYLDVDSTAREHIFIELSTLDAFKKYAIETEEDVDDIDGFMYFNWIVEASKRGRDDIVEYLYTDGIYDDGDIISNFCIAYYPGSKRLRDLFVKHEPHLIQYLIGKGEGQNTIQCLHC
jgi:hypothetical protein